MKQKSFLFMCVGICAISTFISYLSTKSNANANSSLLLANVEALSETDDSSVEMQDCTRAVYVGSCYRKDNGMWQGTFVDAVEHYQIPVGSTVVICKHEGIRTCPAGTIREDERKQDKK